MLVGILHDNTDCFRGSMQQVRGSMQHVILQVTTRSPHWSARPYLAACSSAAATHAANALLFPIRQLSASLPAFTTMLRGPAMEPGMLPPRLVVREFDEVVAEVLEVREQLPPLRVLGLPPQVRTPFNFTGFDCAHLASFTGIDCAHLSNINGFDCTSRARSGDLRGYVLTAHTGPESAGFASAQL